MLESFPFDSSPDLTYDDNGDPRYDRAVGARVLRDTFAKFFSDGVFPNPGTALQISKGDGLKVNVGAGVCIIKGAMGGLYDDSVVTLDSAAPQGNIAYGLMLRYDNNRYDDGTGQAIYLRVVKGDAASDPQPPEPDRTTPGVYELRLGYVVVRNGATSVQAADVHNEKGEDICPFAAPFEELDTDAVVGEFRGKLQDAFSQYQTSGQKALTDLLAYYDRYREMVEKAVGGTLAGDLQNQINELKKQSLNLADAVDGTTIAYDVPTGGSKQVLHVADGGIGRRQLGLEIDGRGGIASTQSVANVTGDLAAVAYALDFQTLQSLDLDSVTTWAFPDDAASFTGQWRASDKSYYASAGTGA